MLLGDRELVQLVDQPEGRGLVNVPQVDDWYGAKSPIQPASVDLTIGAILVPGARPNRSGSVAAPRTELVLKTGETAVVTTAETLRMPPHLGGIGFPPSHISFQGLLMTNPGHVDPGYVGRMRFTVINMAKDPYRLKQGEVIVTLLFIRVAGWVKKDYAERGGVVRDVTQEDVDRLSPDFVDMEKRARRIARATSVKAGVVVALITLVVPLAMAIMQVWRPTWSYSLEQRVSTLDVALGIKEKLIEIDRHKDVIDRLREELKMIREATCQQKPLPRYCEDSARRAGKVN